MHNGVGPAAGEQPDAEAHRGDAWEALLAGSSTRKSDKKEESMHHGGSFHAYMAYKNRKLQEQFHEQKTVVGAGGGDPGLAGLFAGVCIHVNGYTNPTHQELKHLMAMYGGRFEVYYSRQTVTHIVCSNLPDAKVKHYERERNPTPVVRPEWIVDSINARRLLPYEDYVLWQLRGGPGQATLRGFQPVATAQAGAASQHLRAAGTTMGSYTFASPIKLAASSSTCPPSVPPNGPATASGAAAASATAAAAAAATGAADAAQGGGGGRAGGGAAAGAAAAAGCESSRRAGAGHRDETRPDGGCTGKQPSQQQQQQPSTHRQQQQQQQQHSPSRAAGMEEPLSLRPTRRPPSSTMRSPAERGLAAGASSSLPPAALGGGSNGGGSAVVASSSAAVAAVATSNPSATPATDAPTTAAVPDAPPGNDPGYAAAQAVAARERAACEVLRGAPRSTRDDSHFMQTYFKASRLHFIGRWKARIETLALQLQGKGPLPKQPPGSLFGGGGSSRGGGGDGPAASPHERAVLHIDMDCFFAAVATLTSPETLRGRPLAVCHSNSSKGSGEVSSANYEARSKGVRASMFISQAKALCPELVVMPYQFEKYQEVSECVFRILWKYSAAVQPVSCDEAYMDVTGLGDPVELAQRIRSEIKSATGCAASAGVGPNKLLAKMATSRAKPDGCYRVGRADVLAMLGPLPVSELPGVGWSTRQRLEALGLKTVADIWKAGKQVLQRELGSKSGSQLWEHAHGRDGRPVEAPAPRKSLGAEVNWGVRFDDDAAVSRFLDELAAELVERMRQAGVRGRTLELKLKRRQAGAPTAPKFLGHGACDNLSRRITLSRFTAAAAEVARYGKDLLRAMQVPAQDIRGIGLSMSKLDNDPASSSACPGGAAPAKMTAPPPSTFRPGGHWWGGQHQAGAQPGAAQLPNSDAPPAAGAAAGEQQQLCQRLLPLQPLPRRVLLPPRADPTLGGEQCQPEAAAAVDDGEIGGDEGGGWAEKQLALSLAWDDEDGSRGRGGGLPSPSGSSSSGGSSAGSGSSSGGSAGGSPGQDSKGKRPLQQRSSFPGPGSSSSFAAGLDAATAVAGPSAGATAAAAAASGPSYSIGLHCVAAAAAAAAGGDLTLSQVDATVLSELPQELQREVVESLRRAAVAAARRGPAQHPAAPAPATERPAAGAPAPQHQQRQPGNASPPPAAANAPVSPADAQAAATGAVLVPGPTSPGGRLPPELGGGVVDRSVLNALPLSVKREVELQYGLAQFNPPPPRGGTGAAAKRKRGNYLAATAGRASSKRQQKLLVLPGERARGAGTSADAAQPLTMSQIDPGTLAELPEHVRREVLRSLAPAPFRQQPRAHALPPSSSSAAVAGAGPVSHRHGGPTRQQQQQQAWLALRPPTAGAAVAGSGARRRSRQLPTDRGGEAPPAAAVEEEAEDAELGFALQLVEAIVGPRLEAGSWALGGPGAVDSGDGGGSSGGNGHQAMVLEWSRDLVGAFGGEGTGGGGKGGPGGGLEALLGACVEQLLVAAGDAPAVAAAGEARAGGGSMSPRGAGNVREDGCAGDSAGQSSSCKAVRELLQEQLRRLAGVAERHASRLVEGNAEGAATTLRALRRLGRRWREFAPHAAGAEWRVQALAEQRYGGPLALPQLGGVLL